MDLYDLFRLFIPPLKGIFGFVLVFIILLECEGVYAARDLVLETVSLIGSILKPETMLPRSDSHLFSILARIAAQSKWARPAVFKDTMSSTRTGKPMREVSMAASSFRAALLATHLIFFPPTTHY